MRNSEYILFEKSPAANFNEAYPIGNGHLGGMVYGDFPKMRLGLNHDELWTGDRPDSYETFDKEDFIKARELTMEGKYFEASDIISKKLGRYDAACYLTLGDLYIDFEDGEISDYRRDLDLRRSEANVRFLRNGKEIKVSYIVSYPDKAIFARIETEETLDFTVSTSIPLETGRVCENGQIVVFGECPIASVRQENNKSLPPCLEGKKGVAFAAAMSALSDGRVAIDTDGIKVNGATHTTVVFTAVTSYENGYAHGKNNYSAMAREALSGACTTEYADVLSRHLEDVTRYFDRVSISFGDGDRSDIPTSKRIDTFEDENGKIDCDLLTLVFNFGRYLSIASSREGSTPPNLQGIWNDLMDPPWCGNYTTNINLQMNYWHALACNLPELFEPLEHHMRIAAENGEKCAQYIYGAGGFTVHHNSDIFGAAAPAFGHTNWLFFPLAGAWTVGELYRKYEYTLDREYLSSIYPLIEGNARFVLDMLYDDGDYLIVAPATSPENKYKMNGHGCAVARGTTMFGALTRESLDNFINASDTLGVSGELVERAKEVLPRLLPILVSDDGRIEEWYFGMEKPEYSEYDSTHRHTSHLYDLYPARNIADDEVLSAAAKKSLDVRGEVGTGWGLAWKACFRARLGDSEAVMRLLRQYLYHVPSEHRIAGPNSAGVWSGGVYSNLFSSCPPMQIDGSFGITAAICEMLVGEKNGEPYPLPALPKEIKSGSVRGLRIRGNRRVDIDFEDGQVTSFKVY